MAVRRNERRPFWYDQGGRFPKAIFHESSFPHIPVFRGSHMIILLKIPAEIQRILEAACVRDLADIVIGRA